ncbi:MAG: hypothetical protein ACR2O3_10740 [Rhizobiaceae bacterium]
MMVTTFAVSALLVLINVPWIWKSGLWDGIVIIGLPVPYFLSLFLIPALMFLLLVIYTNVAEDIDRHTLEFENE